MHVSDTTLRVEQKKHSKVTHIVRKKNFSNKL